MSLKDAQQSVYEFHRKFGATIGQFPAIRDPILRARLLREECNETCAALVAGDLVETADGLADLVYVALGTAVACGIDLAPIFQEVHRSNMTKTPNDKRADGKITKGPDYSPPDIKGQLAKQGYKP